MEDEKIISLYFERSEDAIKETDAKYGRYCHTVSYNVLRNEEDAEECVNDTWIHTWNAIPPTHPDSLKAFVARIARNLSLNRLAENRAKKRGGDETPAALDELEECIASQSSVEEEIDGRLLKDCINTFLEELSEKQRIVFMQRYFYFYTVNEIAKKNGFTENNVKSLLFRARNRLREYLTEEGFSL